MAFRYQIQCMEKTEEAARIFISKAKQKRHWQICPHSGTHLESSSRVQLAVSSKHQGLGQLFSSTTECHSSEVAETANCMEIVFKLK